ncbi:hypothetical protein KEM60_01735 [Austwickia sp. TVS 96-490-7B]|uniref:hypothetical protein n=1 Tax=Austwickia sp. TVS 96-490-7B TaxID=2830843 RepID=UPI001C57E7B9|nr:hypothetical protein [Austwickia sp. TVS 96-490-7B]MBW3085535.1 hypothetical protein [Austwickia sp. TVS 96-490-7B]
MSDQLVYGDVIIIWRGWGILAPVFVLGGTFTFLILNPHSSLWAYRTLAVLLTLLGGTACWFLGHYLNTVLPGRRTDQFTQARTEELHGVVAAGAFTLGPGHAPPQSFDEAYYQANMVVAHETSQLRARLRNQHSFFFIPMHFFAPLTIIIALLFICW